MSTVTLFKNLNGNCAVAIYVDSALHTVPFVSGKFFTTDEDLEAALNRAAKTREFGIYVDPKEPDIDPTCATPMEQLKRQERERLIAELKANPDLARDLGITVQAPLSQSLANSTNVVGAAELTPAEEALRAKQIADMNTPAAAGTNISQTAMLAKLKGGA